MKIGKMRARGVEPPHRKILEPKSSASASSATLAQKRGLSSVNYFTLIFTSVFFRILVWS